MNAQGLWGIAVAIAACSSPARGVEAPSGSGGAAPEPASTGEPREAFLTQVYVPPTQALVSCPGGVPVKLAPEWHSMKPDDRVSPGHAYVMLDAPQGKCTIGVGAFPRLCKESDGWATKCTNRDGSRPHIGQLRCTATTLQVWVVAPEGEFRIAELPRPAGSSPCPSA